MAAAGPARRGVAGNGAAPSAMLALAIRNSLLPGEAPLAPGKIREIAAFLLETGGQREPGKPRIALRTASEGRRHCAIAIVNDDMPFLVDSIAAAIAARGLAIDLLVHPVIPVRRDREGRLVRVLRGTTLGERRESMIYIETERINARRRQELRGILAAVLADVRAAVDDWPKMRQAMARDAASAAGEEGAALLRWLGGGMLTQIGHLVRRRDGREPDRLGICRRGTCTLLADASFERAFAWFDERGDEGRKRAPLVLKSNCISTVHRRVPIDLFIMPVIEEDRIVALSVHAGIWTSAALHAAPATVPRLRTQIARIIERRRIMPLSHDGNALAHVVTALPRDLLIGFSDADFERVVTTMMALVQRPRPRLVLVEAGLQRHVFAFVWLPRDMVSTEVRLQIQSMLLQSCAGELLDWGIQVEGGNLALLRFAIDIRGGRRCPEEAELDRRLQERLRGWSEAVENALARCMDPARAAALAARYAEAFPRSYRADYGPHEAARDIERLRALQSAGGAAALGRDARLYRPEGEAQDRLRLKIYQLGGVLPLSDAVPALEHFGFRVLSEFPAALENGALATIHDFTLALPEGSEAEAILERAPAIEAALRAVLNGEAENDVFNRLVVGAGLDAREANLLRALYRYLRQTGMNITIYPAVDALDRARPVTRGLIDLFMVRHDPAFAGDRARAEAAAEAAIRGGLAQVEAIADDRLLRQYHAVVSAILRTNFFLPAQGGALAFKLDCAAVPGLPRPVPWREIFVYSPRIEGVHLRAGPVARGGIRWSDRRDDYRTEILGLMKAQRVKNAVIVPTGAKGGFYPKLLPDPRRDPDGWAAEGRECYAIFIRSLLSLTDTMANGKTVHPRAMVVRDGDDPYFVVAADKGTARFSDLANAIAEERGFWLGDAFASGGSHGYDHKAMGITARGAWLSVKRHFIEMGIDIEKQPIRVVGCGDMSGDVFGNGMLLSKTIRLVAAFDHRHIFLDPDPDPATGWRERRRLARLPRSSWDDYDRSLISRGGGVFARTMKRITLSPEARLALGVEAGEMDPDALIAALLRAPVDLLWFGGIGTFVKGSGESHLAVGDPANETLRVDGRDLRAKVAGEGANLAFTQAGRIEFALNGGRINTDFIDNSAGVDCSDNEVNIKIALAAARHAGRLSGKRRDALLAEMTGEVARLVLENNRLQALALSIASIGGERATPSYIRLIDLLETHGELDRKEEGLPENEALARRAAQGRGLTRPELAVLLSTAKLMLHEAIENSALADDAALAPLLVEAFPTPMRTGLRAQIMVHPLRRGIIAARLANRIVNRMGMIHPFELAEEEGASFDQIASAFVCADRLFGMEELWHRLDRARMPEAARLQLFDRAALALRNHMADLLRAGAGALAPSAMISRLAPGIVELARRKDALLRAEARSHSARIKTALVDAGAPAGEADRVAHLFDMDGAVGLARLAADTGLSPSRVTEAFTLLGEMLGLDWAQGCAATLGPSDPWERLLVAGLARDFQQMRFELLRQLARSTRGKPDPAGLVRRWIQAHQPAIAQLRAMIARAQRMAPVAPTVLAQIAGQARNLLARQEDR